MIQLYVPPNIREVIDAFPSNDRMYLYDGIYCEVSNLGFSPYPRIGFSRHTKEIFCLIPWKRNSALFYYLIQSIEITDIDVTAILNLHNCFNFQFWSRVSNRKEGG